jgi:hypothetical protein
MRNALSWNTLVRIAGLIIATWALYDIARQHHLLGF